MITSSSWWKAAMIRSLKTFAQSAVATIGTTAVMSEVNWTMVLSTAALSAVLSLLTSLAGLPEVQPDSSEESSEE